MQDLIPETTKKVTPAGAIQCSRCHASVFAILDHWQREHPVRLLHGGFPGIPARWADEWLATS